MDVLWSDLAPEAAADTGDLKDEVELYGGDLLPEARPEPPTAARQLLDAALSTYDRLACPPRRHAVRARLLALAGAPT